MNNYLTEAFDSQSFNESIREASGVIYFPSTGSLDLTDTQAAKEITEGTERLLRLVTDSAATPWLIFGSSYHVYGITEGNGIAETHTGGIPDEVGRALRHAEDILQKRWPGKLLIFRCAPIFGEGNSERWIMRMFDQVTRGLYFNVRDTDAQRSLVLAYDVARLAKILGGETGVYNVADGFDRTLTTLAVAMGNNYGKGKRSFTLPAKWARIIASTLGRFGILITPVELAFRSTDLTFSTDKLREHPALSDFSFHDTVSVIGRQDDTYPYRQD